MNARRPIMTRAVIALVLLGTAVQPTETTFGQQAEDRPARFEDRPIHQRMFAGLWSQLKGLRLKPAKPEAPHRPELAPPRHDGAPHWAPAEMPQPLEPPQLGPLDNGHFGQPLQSFQPLRREDNRVGASLVNWADTTHRPVIRRPATQSAPADDTSEPEAEVLQQPVRARIIPEKQPARLNLNVSNQPKSEPAAEVRRTSAYLSDEVRFGPVLRPERSGAVTQTTAQFLSETAVPEKKTLSPKKQSIVLDQPEPEPIESSNAPSMPEFVTLSGDDVSALRTVAPASSRDLDAWPSASQSPDTEISASASPAALQRALRDYGITKAPAAPIAQAEPENHPQPPAEPEVDEVAEAFSLGPEVEQEQPAETVRTPQPERPSSPPKGRPHHGSVAGYDQRAGAVLLQFDDGQIPPVGSHVRVYERVFFKHRLLCELTIIGSEGNRALAQPIGKVRSDLIMPGDRVVAFE